MVKIERLPGIAILLMLVLVLTGCPEPVPERDMAIEIRNNSNTRIAFWAPYSESNSNPDTSLTEEFPWGEVDWIPEEDIIEGNSSGYETYVTYNLKVALEEGWIHIHIYVYDSLTSIPWERIRDEYIIAKRVDFDTWEQLEEANFTVTYP